jgi:hypothetical protein
MTKDFITATMLLLAVVVIIVTPRLSVLREPEVKERLDVIAENAEVSVGLLKQANATLHEIARQRGDRWATLTVEE